MGLSEGKHVELLNLDSSLEVCPGQEGNAALAKYLISNISEKITDLESRGVDVQIRTPEWCRENPELAGQLHADVIIGAYGSTYALPNKDPENNAQAISEGSLDVYLLQHGDEVVGTACLADVGNGRAELGRSAAIRGQVGNSIIQDLRILDWLTNPDQANKYHTLFTTLRSAPDREIDEDDGTTFVMRGGKSVTGHWKSFPNTQVVGVAPLYLKHGALEQFTIAEITRSGRPYKPDQIFVEAPDDIQLIEMWHDFYSYGDLPHVSADEESNVELSVQVGYPPLETGLTHLVHADIEVAEGGLGVFDAANEAKDVGSPFIQAEIPINTDTRAIQRALLEAGFLTFGYRNQTNQRPAALLFGKVSGITDVVPTYWIIEGENHPFWTDVNLSTKAKEIERSWR